MKERKLNKNFTRLVIISILIAFLTTSANSAFVSEESTEVTIYDPPVAPLLGGDTYYEWTDDFNNEQNIDITKSWGYEVSGGKARMKNTFDVWTNTDWTKLRPVTVTNSGSTYTDYAVNFIVDYDADMQNDYDDVRFKHESNPANFLSYWIETYDSSEASIWVKIPTLSSGANQMYLFYGNDGCSDDSDYGAVFDDWDEKWANDEMVSACDPDVEGVWDPDVAYGNNEFLVCWEEGQAYWGFPINQGYKQEIRASIFTTSGTETVEDKRVFNDVDNGYTYYHNEDPSIAYGSGGKFGVVWEHWAPTNTPYNPQDITTMDIYGRTVKKSGSSLSLGSVEKICEASNCQADPCITYDSVNNHFVVVWEDAREGTSEYDIHAAICDSNLNVISEKVICQDSLAQAEPWIAFDSVNEQFFIVWEEGVDTEDGPWKIMGGIFDDNLNLVSQLSVGVPPNYPNDDLDYNFPCVEFDPDSERYLVTWNEADISEDDYWGDVMGTIYSASGTVLEDDFTIKSGQYVRTEIANYFSDAFFVSYDNDNKIYGRLVSYEGDLIGSDFKLSAGAAADADWASIASDGSKIFVTWEDDRIEKPDWCDPWYPDAFGNIWNLNIPDGSDISITWGQEQEMILEAQITSKKIQPVNLEFWHEFQVAFDNTITFDILDGQTLMVLIQGADNGEDLDVIDPDSHPLLRIQAHFERDNPSYTPWIDWWKILYEGVDTEPPVTLHDHTDGIQGLDPWWISECVTVWLKSMDYPEDTGSGVKETYYSIDGGATQIYDDASGIHICSHEPDWYGDWTVNFWSVDNKGNVEDRTEQHNYRTIYIDSKRPECWITSPIEEAEVEVPFDVHADATDNAGVEKVGFDIEPFSQRPHLPWYDYTPPYIWRCNEQPVDGGNFFDDLPPEAGGVLVQVRATAYDASGQYWIHEVFVNILNWNSRSKVLVFNQRPLLEALKLGLIIGDSIDVKMYDISEGDKVEFVASRMLSGRQKTIVDDDLSNGAIAKFDLPSGFYKISAILYKDGQVIENDLITRVLFLNI